jgi:hypothetical protein
VRTILTTAVLGGLALIGVAGSNAAGSRSSSLILYRSPASTGPTPSVVHLWTTDGTGRDAHELLTLKPAGRSDPLRGAYLVPDGVILATTDAKDGNVSDVGLVKRGSNRVRPLFSVRGLYSFRPSPDGQEIAYSRSLPIAGKPRLVVAGRDGAIVRTLLRQSVPIFSWSSDGRRLFTYCATPRRRLCSYAVATGASTPTNLDLRNAAATPSVSPTGTRAAFYEKFGPAGERIYTIEGAFLRNLVGHAAAFAVWSPDESRLVLQADTGDPLVFSFRTKRLTSFAHRGPADLFVLDWR